MDLVPNGIFYLSPNGGISYNVNSGIITLSAGKVYRITARLSGNYMQNNGFSTTYAFTDTSNNLLTPNAEAVIASHSGASVGTQSSVNDIVFIAPPQTSAFKLRVTSSNGTCTLNPLRCSICIQSIY
jgi:hypothetical protein